MASFLTEHETRYDYHTRVTTSQHVAVLEPRDLPYQQHAAFGQTARHLFRRQVLNLAGALHSIGHDATPCRSERRFTRIFGKPHVPNKQMPCIYTVTCVHSSTTLPFWYRI